MTCVVGRSATADAPWTLLPPARLRRGRVDFMFMDHDKNAYLPDLQSILDRGWLHPWIDRRRRQHQFFPAPRSTANT